MGNLLLYLATILIWGTTWLGIVFQLGVVDPAVSLVWRFGLASLIMVGWALARGQSLRFSVSDHAWLALQGISLFCANYLLIYTATGLLRSGLVAVACSTIVAMNIVLGAAFFGQPIRPRVAAGAGLGLLGITLVFSPEFSHLSLGDEALRGFVFCLIGTAFASLGNLLAGRNQRAGIGVIAGSGLGMGYGALAMALFAALSGKAFLVDLSLPYLGSLLYLAVFGSVIAFGCYLTLLGRIGADRASYCAVVYPVVALGLSTAFEGYRWSAAGAAGLALVLAGNLLILRRPATGAPVAVPLPTSLSPRGGGR
ncbi:EamA family transporter [Rhodospirillum rubrum]|nr:EamA family transporter [Rhodospirillum rubrum]MBK1675736.1 EamA family transporter [Rhodospirillum rubrum]